ncbi:major facilitator superfamily protein [Tieghemostelium lacteum]|uniref:Major facilitator superfamily protein n=1 Tax=Tieghemostelium lacteum TaxID=361077 RepID=A0A152A940_TIELA|nr:major facilitator superfamily protein [Tieghemostelium lacteum]|eukprot:KYR02743.1 major facilitator superfamily protein [Tieghemostelium lacteum]
MDKTLHKIRVPLSLSSSDDEMDQSNEEVNNLISNRDTIEDEDDDDDLVYMKSPNPSLVIINEQSHLTDHNHNNHNNNNHDDDNDKQLHNNNNEDNLDSVELLMYVQPNIIKDGFIANAKRVLVAGTGFLCDAYDLFVINLVLVILKTQYKENSGSSSIVSTGALWGAVLGQLVFGFVADRVGRRIGFIITLSFIIVGAFGSCASFNISSGFNIYVMLAIWRSILGFGIGGEYPLSATISSETSVNDTKRGSQVASVFSMQGIGIILSPIVVIILLTICGASHIDLVWRLALAFGGIPGLIMIYFRLKMKETQSFTRNASIKKRDMFLLIIRKYGKTLLGTAGGWLIFDITFYANGLFNATIVSMIGFGSGPNSTDYEKIFNTTQISIYLALLGLPGYFVGVLLIDRIGRKKLQMGGFLLLSLTYLIMGLTFNHLVKVKWLFIILYGLSFFFGNAGPNTTTFVLPSESFPTKVRATCHGISAACGKIGAVIGGAAISPFFHAFGLGKTLIVCSSIAFVGFLLTFFIVQETMGKPIQEDELSIDDDTIGANNNNTIELTPI